MVIYLGFDQPYLFCCLQGAIKHKNYTHLEAHHSWLLDCVWFGQSQAVLNGNECQFFWFGKYKINTHVLSGYSGKDFSSSAKHILD